MCGFVGCIRNKENIDLGNIIESMNMLIDHRGPDDEGYYADGNVSLGFRRLSIIALESGHQPLSYENERYWIVFNGEIYNYLELRDELLQLGYEFTTESDTEVVVGLYSVYKEEEVVSRLRGMFSFLIWDKHLKILFGAREIINFNVALLVGFIAGVYSSIYISNQLWLILESRKLKKPVKPKRQDDDEINEIQVKGVNC